MDAGALPDAVQQEEPPLCQGPEHLLQDPVPLPLLHLYCQCPGDSHLHGHPHHLHLAWPLPRHSVIHCYQLDDCLHSHVLPDQVLRAPRQEHCA